MNPVFPSRMLATCTHGHTWPVEVTWTPMQVTAPSVFWDERMQVPHPQPRFCAECFLTRHAASMVIGLRALDEPPTTPETR